MSVSQEFAGVAPSALSDEQNALLNTILENIKQESTYVFNKVRSPCVQLTTILQQEHEGKIDVNKAEQFYNTALQELINMVSTFPPLGITKCLDYILFPLFSLIKKDSPMSFMSQQQSSPSAQKKGPTVRNSTKELILRVIHALLLQAAQFPAPSFLPHSLLNWNPRQFGEILYHVTLTFPSFMIPPTATTSTSNTSNSGSTVATYEELKIATVSLLHVLFENSSKACFDSISTNASHIIAHVISTLVEISSPSEKNRKLKFEAISTLKVLMSGDRLSTHMVAIFLPGIVTSLSKIIMGDYKQGTKVLTAAIDTFSIVVSRALSDKENQGVLEEIKKETNDPLLALKKIQEQVSPQHNSNTSSASSQQRQVQLSSPLEQKRDRVWLSSTVEKVNKLFELIFSKNKEETYQTKWKVRLSLVDCTANIATTCLQTLEKSVPLFIDVLVLHMNDEFDTIATKARSALSQLSHMLSSSLLSVIYDNMQNLFSSLPRLIRRASNERETVATLKLIVGYIALIGPTDPAMLNSLLTVSLSHITIALAQILEFESYDVRKLYSNNTNTVATRLLTLNASSSSSSSSSSSLGPGDLPGFSKNNNTPTIDDNNDNYNNNDDNSNDVNNNDNNNNNNEIVNHPAYPKKVFKHFRDDFTLECLQKIPRLLGYYADTMLLIDHYIEILRDQHCLIRKQVIFMLNEMILGTSAIGIEKEVEIQEDIDLNISRNQEQKINTSRNQKLTDSHVTAILDEYLTPSLWDLFTENSMENSIYLSVDQLNDNIITLSLLCEGIGNIADVLQEKFDLYLITTLYPLVEKLGDRSSVVSQSAWAALHHVTIAVKEKSINTLLRNNLDYLIEIVIQRLNNLYQYPNTPQVLTGIFQYIDNEGDILLPLLDDVLDSVLSSIDDWSNIQFIHTFMRVLYNIVLVFNKKIKKSQKESSTSTPAPTTATTVTKAKKEDKESNNNAETTKRHATYEDFLNVINESKEEEEEEKQEKQQTGTLTADVIEAKRKRIQHDRLVSFIVQILEKMQHFLSSKSPHIRLLVCDIIIAGIPVAASPLPPLPPHYKMRKEDELDPHKLLLPLIHNLWQVLKKRFTDPENVVVLKALQVVNVFFKYGKDFVLSKFQQDLWPLLPKLLSSTTSTAQTSITPSMLLISSHSSSNQKALEGDSSLVPLIAPSSPNSLSSGGSSEIVVRDLEKFEFSFKFQKAALKCIRYLAQYVDKVYGETIIDVLNVCKTFLHESKHPILQKLTVEIFQLLIRIDTDAVWYTIQQLQGSIFTSPAKSLLPSISLYKPGCNHYKYNCEIIMKYLRDWETIHTPTLDDKFIA